MADEKSRLSGILRTVTLIADLIGGAEFDRKSAARRLGVQPAAANRQLQAIARIPGMVPETRGGIRTLRFELGNGSTPSADFGTVIAACFGASLGPLFTGTPYEQAMARGRDLAIQHSSTSARFRNVERKFLFLARGGESSFPDQAGPLDDLIDAVLGERWVSFGYEDFSGDLSRERVQPLTFVVYEHQLYVIGRDAEGALHPYRFSRMSSLDADGAVFGYPSRAEYDPARLFSDSFGIFFGDDLPVERVELQLDHRWRRHVQTHRWHPSQTYEWKGGALIVRVQVHLCPEVEAWVLSFGPDAKVLKPDSLREVIAKKARAAAAQYV